MTSGECFENKWFYMKYIGKYLSVEILLTNECTCTDNNRGSTKLSIPENTILPQITKFGIHKFKQIYRTLQRNSMKLDNNI
jgi:hypothetical protein